MLRIFECHAFHADQLARDRQNHGTVNTIAFEKATSVLNVIQDEANVIMLCRSIPRV